MLTAIHIQRFENGVGLVREENGQPSPLAAVKMLPFDNMDAMGDEILKAVAEMKREAEAPAKPAIVKPELIRGLN